MLSDHSRVCLHTFLTLILLQLGIPFRVLAATAKDEYRKPDIGMWTLLNQTYAAQGFPLGQLLYLC